jgi:hypothetical protein
MCGRMAEVFKQRSPCALLFSLMTLLSKPAMSPEDQQVFSKWGLPA